MNDRERSRAVRIVEIAKLLGVSHQAFELLRECETVAADLGDEAALSWTWFALGGALVGQGDEIAVALN